MLALAGLFVSACQPGINPVVPSGASGYAAIADGAADLAPDRYSLQAGDRIGVNVFREPDLTVDDVLVDRAGNIALPLIGAVRAQGLSTTELAQFVQGQYGARYLRDPQISITLKESPQQTIAVEGQVALPGVYPFRPGHTLLTAMAQARSPTQTAQLNEVLVFRTINGQRVGGQFDLNAIRGGAMDDPALMPGDVVVVGFSEVRGIYRDILQTAPVLGIFRPF